jgi:hypothetical protein
MATCRKDEQSKKNRMGPFGYSLPCLEAWRRRDLASRFLWQKERLELLTIHRDSERTKRRASVQCGVAE